ncbi:bluetail domain-containing putative surface protein, partial [Okeania sp. SIO2G5]|uniref:bluetail domain-containing putative surface protein n=1 Tax=Okeania sp. SIO2G5 TaxID=2607796 RepID=UPI0013C089D4
GNAGKDTFFLGLKDSLLGSIDHITDLAIGTDRINGPKAVAAPDVHQLGEAASLSEGDLQSVLTTTAFVAHGAATFTVGAQTFVALNDKGSGFDRTTDAIIEITGFTGELSELFIF